MPVLGKTLLYQLTTDDIEACVTQQLKQYTPATVCKDYDFLSRVLKKAYATRKIMHNPALAVVPPRKAARDLRDVIDYYTPQDVKKIIAGCKANLYKDNFYHNEDENNIYARAMLLALFTGMRRGEVCGLQFCDLHLDAPIPYLRIERARTDTCGGFETQQYETKATKTHSSVRNLAIMDDMVTLLRFLEQEYAENKARAPQFYDSGFVICYSNGTLPHPRTISTGVRKLAEKFGLSQVLDFKALRHTFATLARDGGSVTPFELQNAMGHTSIRTTEKYYLGSAQDVRSGAVVSFQKLLDET